MSNFSQVQEASRDGLRAIAIGEARGATSITSFAILAARDTERETWEPKDAGSLYPERFAWVNAERVTLGKEPISVPQGKSLAAQVSKFRGFLELGVVARERGDVLDVLDAAASAAGHNYKKTLASVGAMRVTLGKSPDVSADDLLGDALAAQVAAEKPAEKASEAFEKIARAWDKMGSDHPEMFQSIALARPGLPADVSAMLTRFSKVLALTEATIEAMDA